MAKKQAAERAEAIATLKKFGVKPGARIYTSVENVSRSGMSRHIHVYIVSRDKYAGKVEHRISEITGLVGRAIGYHRNQKSGGLVVGGAGMDMGFHVVYSLGRAMFPDGGPLAKSEGSRQRQEAAKGRETDGGYLLRHDWI
jgi:hypothetical protein